ncbi:efflux RND transporter periplasmic adaptor subunit [Sphingorhabdus sp. EL138]|uniref:efflux RND transporter periplasmic adaptor subunit n=1 Tax=Sphingorhabdus sp. EL138 TaxID=2073156 RepID=UPI000D69039F|nr:efflux RND transporter periplasmic adaptor subunit [Sphingorhabdus sp. EL138]
MSDETGDGIPDIEEKSKAPWLWGGGIALAAIIGVGIASSGDGPNWSSNEAAMSAAEEKATETTEAQAQKPEPKSDPDVRGVIKPKQESTVASRMTARITSMPFGKGQSFRKGALLAQFDCSAIRAELRAAQAAANAYNVTYKTNVELDQYEAIGKNEVAVAKANLGKANAEANAIKANLTDCAVYAPFSGTVVEEIAGRGEIAASGQPLLTIQSGGDLEVELIVPSNWLTWLRPGADFTFKIDETGADVTGQITRLGASVDPVSKTIRVTGNVDKTESLVLPGMSGTGVFVKPDAKVASNATRQTAPQKTSKQQIEE